MLHKRALLALEDDGAGIQGFHAVPDILSHVHAVAAFRWVEDNVLNDGAVIVVGDDTYPATQHNKPENQILMNPTRTSMVFPLFCTI